MLSDQWLKLSRNVAKPNLVAHIHREQVQASSDSMHNGDEKGVDI